ncbi:hypothetical protein PN446_16955, partial [Microcystis aeruginosa CS-567/02]|nr:hypothetical protein [Microcystis aeruginosa CS-567/02]
FPTSPLPHSAITTEAYFVLFVKKTFFLQQNYTKKKIIVVGEIDRFTCLNWDQPLGVARVSTIAVQKSTE